MAGDLVVSTINGVAIGTKNVIINGNFNINQRAVSGTVTLAAGAYGHDRFKAGASGCTYTFATVENVTTITISAGSLIQVIEGLNLQTGTYTLSWSGTAQGKIGGGSYSATGVTGSATGGTNLNVEFNTGTLSLVQLEKGSTATSFDYRPYGTELALCQRYAIVYGRDQAYNEIGGTGFAYGTTAGDVPVSLPVQMRTTPTLSTSGNFQISDGAAATAITSLSIITAQSSTQIASIRFNVASGATTFRPYRIETNNSTTATATFSAEL